MRNLYVQGILLLSRLLGLEGRDQTLPHIVLSTTLTLCSGLQDGMISASQAEWRWNFTQVKLPLSDEYACTV